MSKSYLSNNDPEPISVINKDSTLIFSGSHNGIAVPSCLPQCLGTDPDWFYNAHEATDLHMNKLFAALKDLIADASYIEGNYSRLVCDLNAMPDYSIPQCSSEHKEIKITANLPDNCCNKQRILRLNNIYHPYHDTKKKMIERIRQINGQVINLDMHSFSPTWKKQPREAEIGTIRCEKTPLSRALEEYLKTQTEYCFISGQPYRVAERPSNSASLITQTNDLQYIGIEIRNDLISSPEGIEKMVNFINKCVDHLYNHPDFEKISAPRSLAFSSEIITSPDIGEAWSI